MRATSKGGDLPEHFWRMIGAAVLLDLAGLFRCLWLGLSDWLAVSVPIFTVNKAFPEKPESMVCRETLGPY